ncbi:MAG TPA: response regulator [Candidatus Saccharimonadia bacterium]|jgi:CheY-like chemotaxis protein|nr:response regulator [Candidatus Saccharimonadia bacterium]
MLARPRVLVVEDDDVIREIYTMKFELEGFPVESAANGQIALNVVEEFDPEIILLDMMMPVMNGLDFMRGLQIVRPDKQPAVVVFSNISAPQQVASVMKLGAKAHWTKSDYTPDRAIDELMAIWEEQSKGESSAS